MTILNKKLLFLSTINPGSRLTGKSVMVYGMAQYLYGVLGSDLFLFACFERDGPVLDWPVVYIDPPHQIHRLFNSFWFSFIRHQKSIQESFFYSDCVIDEIHSLVDKFKPDVIVIDTIRLGQYLEKISSTAYSILYLEDMFSLRYKRQICMPIDGESVTFNPLGNFNKHLPNFLQKLVAKSYWFQKLLLTFEMNLVVKSEISQAKLASTSLLINEGEADILRQNVSCAIVRTIPPRLKDVVVYPRIWSGQPVFLFLGSLNQPHNIDGILSFFRLVFPSILSIIPTIKVRVIGKYAPAQLLAFGAQYPMNISIEGYVDDVNAVLASVCALIAPLRFGSGVKIKIIDALACSTPIITTPVGVDGIQFTNNIHGMIYNNISDFPLGMLKALDTGINASISNNCADLYRKTYSRDSVDLIYREIFTV